MDKNPVGPPLRGMLIECPCCGHQFRSNLTNETCKNCGASIAIYGTEELADEALEGTVNGKKCKLPESNGWAVADCPNGG